MLFEEVVKYFEKLEKTSSRLEMMRILKELYSKVVGNGKEAKYITYLIKGEIYPPFINKELGVGEGFLIEGICLAYGAKKEEVKQKYEEEGDLGIVAEYFSKRKKQLSLFKERLSVEKVYLTLRKISELEGEGSQSKKIRYIADLFNSSSPLEARYLARILINNLRLGVGDPTILESFALIFFNDFKKVFEKEYEEIMKNYGGDNIEGALRRGLKEIIEKKYNILPDLGEIAEILFSKGLEGIKQVEITIGIPIRPALAERLSSPEEIIKKIGPCFVEGKYDGFRVQVHKKGDKIKLFSRRLEDITNMLPDVVDAIKKEVEEEDIIFEGEAIGYDELTEEFLPFQIIMQRKRKYDVDKLAKKYPLYLFSFDILYYNGSMLEKPFKERRKTLESIIKKREKIRISIGKKVESAKELEKFFLECVEKGLEGIVAKDLNEKYVAGARKFAWIKLKRSYKGELQDTVDCVILGYFKGKGQRAKFGLGALLVGIYDKEKDIFKTIAKVGSGLTESLLEKIKKELDKIRVDKKPARVLSLIEPDVWVEPKIVVKVAADEITKSPIHTCCRKEDTGLALRFPRLIEVRVDKNAEDATTEKEIEELYMMQKKKEVFS